MRGDSERRGKERVSRYPVCGTWVLPSGRRPLLCTVICFAPSARGSGCLLLLPAERAQAAAAASGRSGSRGREDGKEGRLRPELPAEAAQPRQDPPRPAQPRPRQVRESPGTAAGLWLGGRALWGEPGRGGFGEMRRPSLALPRPGEPSLLPVPLPCELPAGAARACGAGSLASMGAHPGCPRSLDAHLRGTPHTRHPVPVAPLPAALVPLPRRHGCVHLTTFTSVLLPSLGHLGYLTDKGYKCHVNCQGIYTLQGWRVVFIWSVSPCVSTNCLYSIPERLVRKQTCYQVSLKCSVQ